MNTINKPINSSNINQSIDDDELSNAMQKELNRQQNSKELIDVSYTHLTLPTIYSV